MTVQLNQDAPAGNDDPEPASTAEEPPERSTRRGGLVVDVVLSRDAMDSVDGSAHSWLVVHARRTGEHLDLDGELRVRVVGDAEMIRAHEAHLGDRSTTDVMTFDLADGAAASGSSVDADVLVCVDEASRRAAEHGYPVERELLLYVLHGLLHCLGYDDHDEASYQRMHELEDSILEAIGVGATFMPERGA